MIPHYAIVGKIFALVIGGALSLAAVFLVVFWIKEIFFKEHGQ